MLLIWCIILDRLILLLLMLIVFVVPVDRLCSAFVGCLGALGFLRVLSIPYNSFCFLSAPLSIVTAFLECCLRLAGDSMKYRRQLFMCRRQHRC
jgi:hypothetical protein